MRHVDFDLGAARRAVAACRDAADTMRFRAGLLRDDLRSVEWTGGARREADDRVQRLAGRLLDEAVALDRTADAIEDAIGSALGAERSREAAAAAVAAAAAAAAAAEPCATTPMSWTHGGGP